MARVLIVDDSLLIRILIKEILEQSGHVITGDATNAAEGLSLFSSARPDLVVIDVILPDMSGLELLKKIRMIDEDVRVLVITAVTQDALDSQILKLGVKRVLHKPFSKAELDAAVFEALK